MGDGSLSQEEIDALLMGEDPEPNGSPIRDVIGMAHTDDVVLNSQDDSVIPVMHPDTEDSQPMSKDMEEFFRNLPNMQRRTEEKRAGSREDLLSQDEIDQMLSAISDGDPIQDSYSSQDHRRVRMYDVKRADRIPRSDLRSFEDFLSDLLPFILGSNWAEVFGSGVSFRVNSVDELTHDEVSRSLSDTAVIGELALNSPLEESAYIVYSQSFCNLLIDTILKHPPMDPKRTLTDLDLNLIEGYFVRESGSIREILSSLLDLRPRLSKIEPDRKIIRIGRDDHHCVLINYTLQLNKEEYEFDWVFGIRDAQKIIKFIQQRLDSGVGVPYEVLHKSVNVECTVQLKEDILLNMQDLATLKPGDILPLKSLDLGLFTR